MATTDVVDDGGKLSNRADYHGSSDQLIDPWCNHCYEETKTKVEAVGFCPECTFLCTACLKAHNRFSNRFSAKQNHNVLQGTRMPKTQTDKPAKYFVSDIHSGYVNDRFCMDHTDLDSTDIQDLRNVTETVKDTVTLVKNTVEQHKYNIKHQNSEMIKQVKELRDKLILEVEDACSCMISNINDVCDKKLACQSSHISTIDSLDQRLSGIREIVAVDVNPQVFIQLPSVASTVRQIQAELEKLTTQLIKVDLKFSTNPKISDFLSAINPLGKVKEVSSGLDKQSPTEEVRFPSTSRKANITKTWTGRIARDVMQIKATKATSLNVNMVDDRHTCDITGMAVTSNNLLLVTDGKNKKVKVFSSDDQLLSSLVLQGKPYHICMTGETTAVVSTDDNKLHTLDISNPGALYEERSVTLGYPATRLASCGNNLAVIKSSEPRCVKMITKTGDEVWSVSKDHNGRQLFKKPCFVTTNIMNDNQAVVVTDAVMEKITVLDATRGDVIKIIDVKGKNPHGLTVDNSGNIYVCYRKSKDICVWSAGFRRSRILLSVTGRQPNLWDIVYCERTDEIFIWDFNRDTLDRFQLS